MPASRLTAAANPRPPAADQPRAYHCLIVDFFSSALIGVFLGFVFGVGCALAVMYSIYMGGYRAAVKDAQLSPLPQRLIAARAKYTPTPTSHD